MMTQPTPERSIVKEVAIAAAPDRVFRALTDAGELGEWIALSAESDPRPGGAFRYNWTSMGVAGVYGQIEPNRLIETHWDGWEPDQSSPVIWELAASDGGTRVRMTNVGSDGPEWDEAYAALDEGWDRALRDLKDWVETGKVRPDGFRTE